jgi:uncharacterized membrane protein YwzB
VVHLENKMLHHILCFAIEIWGESKLNADPFIQVFRTFNQLNENLYRSPGGNFVLLIPALVENDIKCCIIFYALQSKYGVNQN